MSPSSRSAVPPSTSFEGCCPYMNPTSAFGPARMPKLNPHDAESFGSTRSYVLPSGARTLVPLTPSEKVQPAKALSSARGSCARADPRLAMKHTAASTTIRLNIAISSESRSGQTGTDMRLRTTHAGLFPSVAQGWITYMSWFCAEFLYLVLKVAGPPGMEAPTRTD